MAPNATAPETSQMAAPAPIVMVKLERPRDRLAGALTSVVDGRDSTGSGMLPVEAAELAEAAATEGSGGSGIGGRRNGSSCRNMS